MAPAVAYLVAQGHHVTNGDLAPLGLDGVPDLRIEATPSTAILRLWSALERLISATR